MSRFLPLAALIFLGCVSGCGLIYPKSYGKVEVGQPQVFTRERLVEDRLREYQWVRSQLDKPFERGFQGYTDRRLFQGIYQRVEAEFSPLKARIEDIGFRQEAATLKRQGELADLLHKMELLEAQAKLSKLQGSINSGTYTPAQGPPQPSPSTGLTKEQLDSSLTEVRAAIASLETKIKQVQDKPLGGVDQQVVSLPSPSPEGTRAQLTGTEKVTDEKAFRDSVNAILREEQLDDTHDLLGRTLYEMKFDISLVPGMKTDDYAEVLLHIKGNHLPVEEYRKTFTDWAESFASQFTKEVLAAQKRLQTNGSSEHVSLMVLWLQQYHDQITQEVNRTLKTISSLCKGADACKNERFSPSTHFQKEALHSAIENAKLEVRKASQETTLARSQEQSSKNKLKQAEDFLLEITKNNSPEQGATSGVPNKTNQEDIKSKAQLQAATARTEYETATKTINAAQSFETTRRLELARMRLAYFTSQKEYVREYCLKEFQGVRARTAVQDTTLQATACAIKAKYQGALLGLVEISDPQPTLLDLHQTYYMSEVQTVEDDPTEEGLSGFWLFLKKVRQLDKVSKPYIAFVEPKEYAQNISDVAARENLSNFVLSLSATLPNGINPSSHSQYIRRSQELLQSILRRPLVMAFNNYTDEFGWILGPRFEIEGTSARFSYAPVRHSYTVTIGIPAWHQYVCISAKYAWIQGFYDSFLSERKHYPAWTSDECPPEPSAVKGSENYLKVLLAPDMTALTYALVERNDRSYKRPRIEVMAQTKSASFRLVDGRKNQSLLIPGRELWRNPQVFVGSKKADRVEILPDMGGVVAYFNDYYAPAKPMKKTDAFLKEGLTVVTSFGKDYLEDAVSITLEEDQRKTAAQILSHRVISGEKLAVKIEDLPSSFASLRLNLRPIGSSSQSVSVDQFEQLANNSYAWTLSLAAITQPTALGANLQLLRSPLDTNSISLLENSAFVYFPKPSDSQIQLQTEKVQLDTSNRAKNELVLEIPKHSGNTELFHKAYPGLSDAVLSRTLSLSLFKKTGEKALNLTPDIKDNRLTVSAELLSTAVQNGLQPGKYDLKLEYGPAREPISAHKELEISK